MKRLHLSILALAGLLLFSCSKKQESPVIIIKKPQIVKPGKPQKMGDYTHSTGVNWVGNHYTVETHMQAVDSLPLASDGSRRYYDNSVRVRIVRADGTDFFNRTFYKRTFKDYVEQSFYDGGALLGILFVRVEGNNLVFAASVGNPDKSSDEYVPIILKINNFGNVSIARDTKPDVNADPGD